MTSFLPSTMSPKSTTFPLLSYKLWYLFYFAAQYTQLFLPLLLSSVFHYNPSQIGVLIFLRRIIICLVAPLFTRLLDVTLLHKPFLLLTHSLYYISSLLLTRVRSLPAVTLLLCLRESFVSGCEPTMDNATVAKLDQQNRPSADYGSLRFYGSIGWGFASVGGSYIIDNFFGGNLLFVLYFQVILGFFVVVCVACMDLSRDLFASQRASKAVAAVAEGNHPQALLELLRSPRVRFCAAAVTMQGVVLGVLQTTTFIYMASLGVSTSVLGLSVFLSCALEAVVFLSTRRLWELLGGAHCAFVGGMIVSSVTLVGFAAVHFARNAAPWYLVVETLNGGTYAMFLTAAVAVVSDMAPPKLATSAQGALAALGNGLGPAVGALLSGLLYNVVGAPAIYVGLAMTQMALVALPISLGIKVVDEMEGVEEGLRIREETTPLL